MGIVSKFGVNTFELDLRNSFQTANNIQVSDILKSH